MAKKFAIGKARTVTMEAPTVTITAPKNPVGRPRKVQTVVEVPVVVTRGRGRPRKVETEVVVGAKKAATRNGTKDKDVVVASSRPKRITNQQLLQADAESGRVPLAAQKMIDQFQALLSRADVQEFRGRKVKPQIIVSTMEQQALTEALILFEEKLTLQRGGQLRRVSSK